MAVLLQLVTIVTLCMFCYSDYTVTGYQGYPATVLLPWLHCDYTVTIMSSHSVLVYNSCPSACWQTEEEARNHLKLNDPILYETLAYTWSGGDEEIPGELQICVTNP